MASQTLELPPNVLGVTYYGVIGVLGFVATTVILGELSLRAHPLRAIPTIGSSSWLGSWLAGFKYLIDSKGLIHEGYEKYKGKPFKIAEVNHWTVMLSDRKHLDEVAKANADDISLVEAVDDQLQIRHVLGCEIMDNPYHTTVIYNQFTRHLPYLYFDVRDEITAAFDDLLDLRGNEWKSVPALATMERIICRTSNRAFVGLPLCRNPEWLDLVLCYTSVVLKAGVIVSMFPESMRTRVARWLTDVPRNIQRGIMLLGPTIEAQIKLLKEYGTDWEDRPNNLLTWLTVEADATELTVKRLTNRILVVNFAAIHTSSNLFTQTLIYLAAHPQYLQPLREEVESVVEKHGWSKATLSSMRRIDSFLREVIRIDGLTTASLGRKAMKPFTLSDGTFIPKGTILAAPSISLHNDPSVYDNPEVFDPFRFSSLRDEDGMGLKYQFSATSPDYLPFGHGKHACPGRFFAAWELKSMLAHIVTTYDVRLDGETTSPTGLRMGILTLANSKAKILFRNRVD